MVKSFYSEHFLQSFGRRQLRQIFLRAGLTRQHSEREVRRGLEVDPVNW